MVGAGSAATRSSREALAARHPPPGDHQRARPRRDRPFLDRQVGVGDHELGVHLEGPFLNAARAGIHDKAKFRRLDEPATLTAHVVGPICETGDVLGRSRRLAPAAEGDVLLIANAGAYGRVMSSRYNLREPAGEALLPPK